MRVRSHLVGLLFCSALGAGCSSETVEEYPSSDELPITEPVDPAAPGPATMDTVLDPVVIPPAPGTTPP